MILAIFASVGAASAQEGGGAQAALKLTLVSRLIRLAA